MGYLMTTSINKESSNVIYFRPQIVDAPFLGGKSLVKEIAQRKAAKVKDWCVL